MMNDALLQTVSGVVQIIASVASILSVIYTPWQGSDEGRSITRKFSNPSPGHEEVYPFYKWFVYISFGLYCVATCVLLYVDEVADFYLQTTIGTFVVMLVAFFILAAKGKHSLESRCIIAPKKLWQVIFNQIPSYLEEIDGPLNIVLVDIGVDSYNSLGIEDEQNFIDDNLGHKAIKERVIACKKDLIESAEKQFAKNKTPLCIIKECKDLFSHRSDKQTIHGIIAFIGNGLVVDEVNSRLHFLAKKFRYTPIGYVSYGAYPSSKFPPYINLQGIAPQDYINHIIFRYYTRSRAWQRLARSYHKFFLWTSIPLLLMVLWIPVRHIIKNYRVECSKMVLTSPEEQDEKTNFTRLVNALLVSPRPHDVKIWEKIDSTEKAMYVNTYRYSEQGYTSSSKTDSSMIARVMQAKCFLVYDKKAPEPYKVWNGDGKECEGYYNQASEVYFVPDGDNYYIFKWIPKRRGPSIMDDNNIRAMYSYNGKKAVEIIYAEQDSTAIRNAIRHSDTYLLGIQQFLIAATLDGLELDKKD